MTLSTISFSSGMSFPERLPDNVGIPYVDAALPCSPCAAPVPGWVLPPIKRVHFNGDKCVILWDDPEKSKTIATCGQGETFDRYTGFMAAVCKKLFGGTTSAKKLLDEKDAGLQAALQQVQAALEKVERVAAEAERAKRAHERKVKAAMKRIAIHTEAAQRLQDGDYKPRHAKRSESGGV